MTFLRRPSHDDAPLTAADAPKLILAVLLSAVVTHYLLQIVILCLGGHPNFQDVTSLGFNVLVMAFFLSVGWLVRNVLLVSLIFLGIGLTFLFPYLFVLKGTWNTWAMQFATYILLPVGSYTLFTVLSRAAQVPSRPRLKRRLR